MEIRFSDYYKPQKKQLTAHQNGAPFLLFGGAMGGGKSWFLSAEAILNAMKYPGNRLAILRKERTTAKKTILVTFFSICPPHIISKFNQQDLIIEFINGSQLIFMEANKSKDPLLNKIKGLELGWAGMDEANELDEEVFNILKTRLRWRLPNGNFPKYQIRLTTNPENCWLIPRFVESKDPKHVFIQSLTTDNYAEDSEYVKLMKDAYKYNPELLARYFDGLWLFGSASNQLIVNELIEFLHNEITNDVKNTMRCMGVDPARYGDDRTCFYIMEGGQTIHVETWSKTSAVEIANRAMMLIDEYRIQPWKVGIDVIGFGGGVVDILYDRGVMVEAINSGDAPEINIHSNEFRFLEPINKRAQLFMALRNDIAGGFLGGLPLFGQMDSNCVFYHDGSRVDNDMVREIKKELGWIRYTLESGKKLQILGKEKMKKMFGKSPDLADSYAIANWMRRRDFSGFVGLL